MALCFAYKRCMLLSVACIPIPMLALYCSSCNQQHAAPNGSEAVHSLPAGPAGMASKRSVRFASQLSRNSAQSDASPHVSNSSTANDVKPGGRAFFDGTSPPHSSGPWRMQSMPDPFREDVLALAGGVEPLQRTRSEGAEVSSPRQKGERRLCGVHGRI